MSRLVGLLLVFLGHHGNVSAQPPTSLTSFPALWERSSMQEQPLRSLLAPQTFTSPDCLAFQVSRGWGSGRQIQAKKFNDIFRNVILFMYFLFLISFSFFSPLIWYFVPIWRTWVIKNKSQLFWRIEILYSSKLWQFVLKNNDILNGSTAASLSRMK